MKRLITTLFFSGLIHIAYPANVVWDGVELSYAGTYDGVSYYSFVYPYVSFSGAMEGSVLTLWADANDYMEISSMWCLAEKGNEASVENISNMGAYFYAADFAEGEKMGGIKADYPLSIETGTSIYLEMICKTYTNPDDIDVGWIELACDEEGVLSIAHSAIDLDGDELIVGGGAVPEPSSGLLCLVGLLVLALRRPRENGTLCW